MAGKEREEKRKGKWKILATFVDRRSTNTWLLGAVPIFSLTYLLILSMDLRENDVLMTRFGTRKGW